MLEVTQDTLLFLLRALEARHAPENVAMRLSRDSGKLELFPDQEQPGDRGFDAQERTVLVIAKDLAESLDGQRLCVLEDSSGEAQLHLEPS